VTDDWNAIFEAGIRVPEGGDLDALTAALARCLRDPDPDVRDGVPYVVLRTWIARDIVAGERRLRLGDAMAARFADDEIQARTFAPLVLDMIVSRGDFAPAWLEAFTHWYATESDLRGFDPELGWLHAVAHGADLLGTFGTHPRVDPTAMLALAARRLLARTDHVFDQREDDRLAGALARVLTRPELTAAASTAWLDPIDADFAALGRGPVPVHATNTMRTLRMLYLLADRGVPLAAAGPLHPLARPDALKDRLADVLDRVFGHAPVKDFPTAD
jgi:hypothetical protein